MQTVLDIILHYSGSAGKEDKDMGYNFEDLKKRQEQAVIQRVAEARESEVYTELVAAFMDSIDQGYKGVRRDFYSRDEFIIRALKEDGFDVTYTEGTMLTSPKIKISIPTEQQSQDVEHKCEGTEKHNREIVRGTEDWLMIHEHDKCENVNVSTDGISYCPFCGVKLGESQ
ncbi:hypothetical protein [Paenibacillus wenxiniae]|uniref:Zinc ribbon domain-containing protein n=1 Tax=Paenibacillus wenxiniae TaxID=1636843 RepID=A0ABW4RDS6_9BACL